MGRFLVVVMLVVIPSLAQQPDILDVSHVTVGSKRLETIYLVASGKWSNARDSAGPLSAEIHCYHRFGFCEVASAYASDGHGQLNFDSFDILRWDANELIAVESSPICVVNTLRVDFLNKKVSLSSASKGETRDKLCKAAVESTKDTVFMTGVDDELKRLDAKVTGKKK